MGKTRRCGFCVEEGHNRATCELLTAQYKRWALRDPGSNAAKYYAQRYAERAGETIDGKPFEKPKKQRAHSTRKCSWCTKSGYNGVGHNRRSCPRRKDWLEMKHRENKAFRYAMRERAKALKIGVGSLIKENVYFYGEDGEYARHECVGLIEKIDWNDIRIDNLGLQTMTVHWLNRASDDHNVRRGVGRRQVQPILRALVPDEWKWASPRTSQVIGYSANPLAGCPDDWEERKDVKFDEPF